MTQLARATAVVVAALVAASVGGLGQKPDETDRGVTSDLNRINPAFDHFLDQVATMSQLVGELMLADLDEVRPTPPAGR